MDRNVADPKTNSGTGSIHGGKVKLAGRDSRALDERVSASVERVGWMMAAFPTAQKTRVRLGHSRPTGQFARNRGQEEPLQAQDSGVVAVVDQ